MAVQVAQKISQNRLLYALTALCGLGILILFGAFYQKRKFNQKLKAEVSNRTSELKHANAHLVSTNHELDEFNRILSHDLKEPLRMVNSYLQLYERRFGETIPDEGREFLDYATDGATRMSTLIDDLLLLSRVRSQAGEFEPVNSKDVMDHVVKDLSLVIEESGAKVVSDTLPVVLADASQLGQLLGNLIGNAIKFRSEKPPEIQVTAERKDGFWKFAVSDNGIGIDETYLDRIFIIFHNLVTYFPMFSNVIFYHPF